jgi:hypothetical protein
MRIPLANGSLRGHPLYGTERPEWFNKQYDFQGTKISSPAEREAINQINTGYLPYMEQRSTAQIPYNTGEFDWIDTGEGAEIFPRTELGSDLSNQMYKDAYGWGAEPDFMWSSPQFTEGLDNSMYGGDRSLIGRNVNSTVNYYTGDTAPKNHPPLRVGDDGITRYDFDAPRPLGFDTSYGVANEADVAQEPLTQKKGNIFQRGWQGAKDFKTSIGEGITGILDNTMIGKIAAMNDATNPRAWNYNPALQGQIDFMKNQGMYGTDWDQSGLNKITGGVLAGKNLQSLFGSNDLGKMYGKSIAQTQKTINNIEFGKQWSTLKKDNPDEYYKKLAWHQNKLAKKKKEQDIFNANQKKITDANIAAEKALSQSYNIGQRGGGAGDSSTSHMGGISQAQADAVGAANKAAGMSGWGLKEGGLASLWPR